MSRHSRFIWLLAIAALVASGCGKSEKSDDKGAADTNTPTAVQTPSAADKAAADKAAADNAAADKAAADKAAAADDPIAAALAHANRPADDKARDAARKPAEVLAFFEVKPGQNIADLFSFSGYYSEILGRVVGPEGKVIAQNSPAVVDKFAARHELLTKRLEDPELAKSLEVKVADFDELGLPSDLDAVFMILAYHDLFWLGADRAKMNKHIFDSLKPGGIYAIVDHHAEAGSGDRDVKSLHRGDAELIKKEILAAGFTLEAESDVLAHPDDKRTAMVFDEAVRGKSDRFIYKFRKPAAAAPAK